MDDIGDSGIPTLRPDHVGNTNDHALLCQKSASNTVNPWEHRRKGNVNPNIEDYLERLYTEVEV